MSASTRDPFPEISAPQSTLKTPLMAGSEIDVVVDTKIFTPDELKGMTKDFMDSLQKNGREAASTKMLAAQIILAFVGAFAGFLYRDPAKTCAEGACDDEWLAAIIQSEEFREYIYFLSGFIGFASTNCTFSFYGPQELQAMLARLDSLTAKALALTGVSGLVMLQGLQIYLAAQGTDASPFNTTMTVLGSLPGALNGAVGMISALPKIAAAARESAQNIYYNLRLKSLSSEKLIEMAKMTFYAAERKNFNAVIAEKWKAVVAHVHELDIDGSEDQLSFLLAQKTKAAKKSWLELGVRGFMRFGVGGALSATFAAPMFYNSYTVLGHYIDNPAGRSLAASGLCSTGFYGNVVLTNKLIHTVTDVVISKLKGEPIDSLVYQLRPWATRSMLAGSIATAVFSYSVVDLMFKKMWGPSNPADPWSGDAESLVRATARTSMIQYHITGPMDVGTQMLAKILKNGTPKEKYLAKLQLFVRYTAELSQADFISQVEANLSPAERESLQVQLWAEFIEQIKGMVDNPEALQSYLQKRGLAQFATAIVALATPIKPQVTVTVSPTAQHWGSSRYLLSPTSGNVSPISTSVIDDERSTFAQAM